MKHAVQGQHAWAAHLGWELEGSFNARLGLRELGRGCGGGALLEVGVLQCSCC